MKIVEKILVIVFLISIVIMNLFGRLDIGPSRLHMIATISAIVTLLGLCIFYVIQTKASIYTLVFILMIFIPLAGYSKIMHLPVSGLLRLIGLLSSILVAGLLIKTGIDFLKDKKTQVLYNFIIAGIILGQFIVAILIATPNAIKFGQGLNYLLVAVIVTMKINRTVLKQAESRVLTIIALQATMYVISNTVELLK